MSSKPESPATISDRPSAHSTWQRRFFMVLTILGWLALAAAIIWGLAKIIGPLVLVGFSALLAYLIFPLVRFFQRHMPRPLAILVSLLVVLAVIGLILYVLVFAAVQQFGQLIGFITDLIQHPQNYPPFQSFLTWLQGLGLSQDQIHTSAQQILGDLQQAISGVVPIVGSIFLTSITLLLVATLTVYFMIDGPRVNSWLRQKTPVKARQFLTMFLDELDRSLGGFVRGQVLLATIMMVVVGLGAFLIGVPYVFLLALIVFVCEFIPQIGAYISGAIGIGFALSHGWQTALIYGIFVTIMQAGLDGQILSPRILGHSVGLNPILSIFALLVGTALFGLLGAFFACPAAAILQTFVLAFWKTWRERHPDQFPTDEQEQQLVEVTGHEGHDRSAMST